MLGKPVPPGHVGSAPIISRGSMNVINVTNKKSASNKVSANAMVNTKYNNIKNGNRVTYSHRNGPKMATGVTVHRDDLIPYYRVNDVEASNVNEKSRKARMKNLKKKLNVRAGMRRFANEMMASAALPATRSGPPNYLFANARTNNAKARTNAFERKKENLSKLLNTPMQFRIERARVQRVLKSHLNKQVEQKQRWLETHKNKRSRVIRKEPAKRHKFPPQLPRNYHNSKERNLRQLLNNRYEETMNELIGELKEKDEISMNDFITSSKGLMMK